MAVIDPTAYIAPGAFVVGNVSLGKEASVWYNAVVRGDDSAAVSIGDQTNIQDLSVVHVDEGLPCTIGNRVTVGHRAIIHSCTIEDDCLIGMGAILLNNVHLGAGSVVGAGALLTEGTRIPPGSLVIGLPARVVREVDDELSERIQFSWKHYINEVRHHRAGGAPVRSSSTSIPDSE